MKTFCSCSIALISALMGAGSAHAALIATADFEDNTTGSIVGQGGGTGWNNNWSSSVGATVVGASLSYSNGAVSSNGGTQAVNVVTGTAITNAVLRRSFATQTNDVYMSFLWNDTVNNDSPGTGDDFAQIGFDNASGDGNPNVSFLRQANNLGLRTGTGGRTDSGVNSAVGTTFMIVLKTTYTGSDFNAELWVNPSSLTEGAADASATVTGISNIGEFVSRVAFGEAGDAYQVDNIRIGTEWSDVVIPEPSAPMMMGTAALMLALRRRRPQ